MCLLSPGVRRRGLILAADRRCRRKEVSRGVGSSTVVADDPFRPSGPTAPARGAPAGGGATAPPPGRDRSGQLRPLPPPVLLGRRRAPAPAAAAGGPDRQPRPRLDRAGGGRAGVAARRLGRTGSLDRRAEGRLPGVAGGPPARPVGGAAPRVCGR